MLIPYTIEELLDERILFCTTSLKSFKTDSKSKEVTDNFEKALDDFCFCRSLLDYIRTNKNDIVVKNRFKICAKKIIFEIASVNKDDSFAISLRQITKEVEDI